jgi:hypothetical protein
MTTNELSNCFQLNEIVYVCKEEIPIYTYVPEVDCESTLLHSSTTKVPETCEYKFFKLSNTFWIPLHIRNTSSWNIYCLMSTENYDLKLYNEGKLTFKNGCKKYSSYVTLYAISTSVVNMTNDLYQQRPLPSTIALKI